LTGATQQYLAQAIAIGEQSALETGGPSAERIGDLWNLMLVASTVVTGLVLLAFAWALWHKRPSGLAAEADRAADARGARVMVGAGAVIPAIILGVLLVITMRVLGAVSLPSHTLAQPDDPPVPGALTVKVTGRQYWWEVEYLDAEPQRQFETANELRIPVGRRVLVRLATDDVIHSFWVPGLGGKMDLVPGRTNVTFIAASRPGVWRGQCAEFCGVQHAKMAFVVVAEPPDRWEAWAARQRMPAAAPRDSLALADREAFVATGCALCHAVRGTPARGELGPDLTHLASRLTLAAGTLPNTPGHRYGWIANPQAIKPGNKMPAVPLSPQQLDAIVRYLGTLR
jgi:cytochrome c oxidase subunit 2